MKVYIYIYIYIYKYPCKLLLINSPPKKNLKKLSISLSKNGEIEVLLGTWGTYWELDGNPVGTWWEHIGTGTTISFKFLKVEGFFRLM
jgi:hypothetical protein